MKTLFNVVAAYVNVCTATVNAVGNALRTEGHVIVPFLRDIRVSLAESNLPAAIKAYGRANREQSENIPAWLPEVLAEGKLLDKEFKALGQSFVEDQLDDDQAVA